MKKLFKSLVGLSAKAGGAALDTTSHAYNTTRNTVSGIGDSITENRITGYIDELTKKFEPIEVLVSTKPNSSNVDDYELVIDMAKFEFQATLQNNNRYVRPKIRIVAHSSDIDRKVLTERMIDEFGTVLKNFEHRMKEIRTKKERRIAQDQAENSLVLMELVFSLVMMALVGLGSLVGPIFFLLVALGGFTILKELPSLTWKLLKRSVGLKVFDTPEDEEIHELRKELERCRPLVQKMVENATIEVMG